MYPPTKRIQDALGKLVLLHDEYAKQGLSNRVFKWKYSFTILIVELKCHCPLYQDTSLGIR